MTGIATAIRANRNPGKIKLIKRQNYKKNVRYLKLCEMMKLVLEGFVNIRKAGFCVSSVTSVPSCIPNPRLPIA